MPIICQKFISKITNAQVGTRENSEKTPMQFKQFWNSVPSKNLISCMHPKNCLFLFHKQKKIQKRVGVCSIKMLIQIGLMVTNCCLEKTLLLLLPILNQMEAVPKIIVGN